MPCDEPRMLPEIEGDRVPRVLDFFQGKLDDPAEIDGLQAVGAPRANGNEISRVELEPVAFARINIHKVHQAITVDDVEILCLCVVIMPSAKKALARSEIEVYRVEHRTVGMPYGHFPSVFDQSARDISLSL